MTPGASEPGAPRGALGRKLALLLALPLLANALLLALLFGALASDQDDEARAAAALDRAAHGQELHLTLLQHRDALRDLLAGTGTARDLEAAALRLERAADSFDAGAAAGEAGPASAAARRALELAGDAARDGAASAALRARFEDAFAQEALPSIEDAARLEADAARQALARAQRLGRRRLWVGGAVSLLSIFLALGPTLLFVRQLARGVGGLEAAARRIGEGDLSEPVPAQEGELAGLASAMGQMARQIALDQDRRELVSAAEARVQAVEEARAALESHVEERTRALARANADLADNLRRLAEAQQKLMVSDRMAAIGQLAASVAHDLNNPISCVSANLRYLGEEVRTLAGELRAGGRPIEPGRESEIASALGDAGEAAERVASIVRDLHTIARGEAESVTRVDLRDAVEAALNVAHAGIRHQARVERRLDAVPAVLGSTSRLGQVFLPLVLQASRAIAARGPSARGSIRVATFTDPRGHAVVEIKDDGVALPPEAVARLFDPFGSGPAAGAPGPSLAVAHGLVTSLGGTIEVQGQPGAGNTVRVVFPPAAGRDGLTPPAFRAA